VNRVAAKIAQKIGMLFKNNDLDAHPGQQEAQHHAGRSAAGDATVCFQRARIALVIVHAILIMRGCANWRCWDLASTFGIESIDEWASPRAFPPRSFSLPDVGLRIFPCHAGVMSGWPDSWPALGYFKFSNSSRSAFVSNETLHHRPFPKNARGDRLRPKSLRSARQFSQPRSSPPARSPIVAAARD